MEKEQIIFLHIPKTAGTTMRGLIVEQYDADRVAAIYEHQHIDEAGFSALPVQEKNKLDVLIGHFGYGFHRHLEGCSRPYRYATFVREPMQRFLSLYNHLANVQFKGSPPDFWSLLRGPAPWRFNNYQTRMISGVNPEVGQCSLEMLDIAIERIEKEFDFVGVTELFNESLVVASEKWGWELRPYKIRNTASRFKADFRSHLSGEDMEVFIDRNSLDIKLYDYCKNRLLESLAKIPDGVSKLEFIGTAVAALEEQMPAGDAGMLKQDN